MKRFNTTGICVASKHYMVNIDNKLKQIKKFIDEGMYFTINRARQYGKTTTLALLENMLHDEYICISLSFQGVGETMFSTEENFCITFLELVHDALQYTSAPQEYIDAWLNNSAKTFNLFSKHITNMCENRKVILFIDEVDNTSDNKTFLHFLGMLREKFLKREKGVDHTFHSIILAGVYDIKNIKLKMINESSLIATPNERKIYNSPWNIAVDFKVDMSFNSDEIASMLYDYNVDYNCNMDITGLSQEIYNYTNGYPYLVSRICLHIDEELDKDWTLIGVQRAVKIMLKEENTLFDDLFKNLENNKKLYDLIYDMLIVGNQRIFSSDSPVIKLGMIYGIIESKILNDYLTISNRIFEIRICNYFIAKDEEKNSHKLITGILQYDIVHEGKFNMELCLRKFAEHYNEIYNPNNNVDSMFLERHGRLIFLSFLKPLINGQGFYHIESQFTDLRRMDIIVDFGREQFIIELKRWYGDSTHQKAYEQLIGYLDSKHMDTGYLLTFDFRKNTNKLSKADWVEIKSKCIFDVVI